MAVRKTLNTGDITYNGITYNTNKWIYLPLSVKSFKSKISRVIIGEVFISIVVVSLFDSNSIFKYFLYEYNYLYKYICQFPLLNSFVAKLYIIDISFCNLNFYMLAYVSLGF